MPYYALFDIRREKREALLTGAKNRYREFDIRSVGTPMTPAFLQRNRGVPGIKRICSFIELRLDREMFTCF